MADTTTFKVQENTPEEVAYKLMTDVNYAEDRRNRTREALLDLYAECLLAVKEPRSRLSGKHKT